MIGQLALQVADGAPTQPGPLGQLLLRQAERLAVLAQQCGERRGGHDTALHHTPRRVGRVWPTCGCCVLAHHPALLSMVLATGS